MTNADIPGYLGIQLDASAFNTVAGGAGFNGPLGPHGECKNPFYESFIPRGRVGEALGCEGDTITYPEVQSLTYRCPDVSVARTAFHTIHEQQELVSDVGDEAALLDLARSDPQSYPDSRVYAISWRSGDFIGFVVLAGSHSDSRIGPPLAELLARRAVARS